MDLETVSHNCRTCGKDSSVGKDVFTNSAIRTWLDKTLNISLEKNDGKSNFVCSVCSQKIRQWILFRANYQKVRKNFELLAEQQLNGEDGKNLAKELKGKASRQQKRLDDWLKPKTSASGEVKTEVDEDGDAITKHQKMAPMRVKIEPKIEADLHDTYGYTGINHISPVKEELKEEVVEDECVDLDEDDDDAEEREAERKKAIATKKRVESIRRKFQKIGERERKNKLIKTQKQALDEARKKTRDVLPTKTARKAPQKPKPISKKKAANVSDVSEDETEKENQTDETLPPRVTRKKVVNYAGDNKGESEDSDPDDPDEVDYYPENDEKSATEDNAAEKDSDSEEEAAEKSDKEEHKETEVQEPVPMETENVPESPKLPAPEVPKQAARRSRPMPLSKKNPVQEEAETQSQPKKSDVAEKEVQASSQKRKLDATEKDDVSEAAPAKKKCLPLSIKKKLEEAERRKKMEAAVTISSGSDSSDSESSSPTTKKKSLLDYFSVKASGNK